MAFLKRTSRLHLYKSCFKLMSQQRNKVTAKDLRKVNENIDAINFMEYVENENTVNFKNVKVITPNNFESHFLNSFKLKFVSIDEGNAKPGIELIRNVAANYDYWIVRKNQSNLLYYRVELFLQRLKYLKSVGLTPRQKLKHIQKFPPLLLFTFTDSTFNGKLIYLRGLIPKEQTGFVHFFYPITSEVTLNRQDIEQRIKSMEEHLEIQQVSALRECLNMPCFFMEPSLLANLDHLILHKHSMPWNYSVDKYTSNVLPPICNLPGLGLTSDIHFSNKATNSTISQLPSYSLDQILCYKYSRDNGVGTSECLSTFLTKAELEEEKDRTGGQPVKGIRGFNVPKRQY
nr:uncharacterized protein LOC124817343 [Hydra vulgaris]